MKTSQIDSILADILAQAEAGADVSHLLQDYPEYESEIQDFLLFQSFLGSQSISVSPSEKGLQRALKTCRTTSTFALRRKLMWKRLWLACKVFTPVLAMSFLVVVSLGTMNHDSNVRVAQIEAEHALQMELQKYQQDQADFEALQQKFFTPKQSKRKSTLIAQKFDYNS